MTKNGLREIRPSTKPDHVQFSKAIRKLIMNKLNLALQQEQEQRVEGNRAWELTPIEQKTDLYYQGIADAAFHIDPQYPDEQSYWQGYQEEQRRYWIRQANPMPEDLYGKEFQGYLYATAHQLTKRYGKISAIGTDKDYKGWEIEISSLPIQIITFDWEEAELETKWSIYSHHLDSLKLLATEFNSKNIGNN